MIKLKLQPIQEACGDCPFYKVTTKNKRVCAFKQLLTPAVAMAVMEDSEHYDPELWDVDCGGSYEKCSFLPLFYLVDEETQGEEEVDEDDEITTYNEGEDDDFDPYEKEEEEPAPPKPEVKDTPVQEDTDDDPKTTTRVSIQKVASPFKVNADVFVFPTNSMLEIDNWEMTQLSGGRIQRQCEIIAREHKIEMGNVYITTNGTSKDFKSQVAPKYIYHAVVSGPSRRVSERDAKLATQRALEIAERQGMETVVIYPFDYGVYDIHAIAIAQLSAVHAFITVNKLESVKKIFIIMEDEDSYQLFKEYYKRVFKK